MSCLNKLKMFLLKCERGIAESSGESFQSFFGVRELLRKGTGLHIMNKRSTVLRLIQIPGGTDGFKVNRGDFRQRHGHMSTSNTGSGGGLKRGAMVCEDERWGSCAGY